MRPRYYVHMAPRPAENVSFLWKAMHITIFMLLIGSSSVATVCIYNILDMYTFHCIIYAKVYFEHPSDERMKEINETELLEEGSGNATESNDTTISTTAGSAARMMMLKVDCDTDPDAPECKETNKLEINFGNRFIQFFRHWKPRKGLFKKFRHAGHVANETMDQSIMLHEQNVNNTGFLNMRKTIFATVYMCDLMLFAPLSSIIMSIFLGALIAVGGKGGAGNPGDLLPNPWICVYPFLGLCSFMMIFCFICDNLFHHGLWSFCAQYLPYTDTKWCSDEMDQFNVQFSPNKRGPPKPFYMSYYVGSIGVQATSALWVIQALIYVLRIVCVADFSVYLTRIRLKSDEGRPEHKMANVVFGMLDSKTKVI